MIALSQVLLLLCHCVRFCYRCVCHCVRFCDLEEVVQLELEFEVTELALCEELLVCAGAEQLQVLQLLTTGAAAEAASPSPPGHRPHSQLPTETAEEEQEEEEEDEDDLQQVRCAAGDVCWGCSVLFCSPGRCL